MKKVLFGLFIAILLFIGYLLIVTFSSSVEQVDVDPVKKIQIPDSAYLALVDAIKIQTITYDPDLAIDTTSFHAFNELLRTKYPSVHNQLEHLAFNDFSHLFYWKGSNPGLQPLILMAHLDVVPIAAPDQWAHNPFEGVVKDGVLWGRGAMDDKFSLMAQLEATERLLQEQFQPERSIYFAFGHDEEIGGDKGAVQIADYLKDKGVRAAFILDEGMAILQDMIPGIIQDIAFIGTAEKGIVSLELTVSLEGGHSSQPAKETPIDVLANAIAAIKSNPLEARISEAMDGFMEQLGPEMPFMTRVIMANRNILSPLILRSYSSMSNAGNALVRTTTAPTIFEAGIKENVLPATARAIVNFRIIPGQTVDEIMSHIERVVADERIDIQFYGTKKDPSPVSSTESPGYQLIEQTIKEVFPEVLVSPNLVVGATDARHFTEISDNIYRFVPFTIHPDNITGFHGVNERVPVEEFNDAIRFYHRLIVQGGTMKNEVN